MGAVHGVGVCTQWVQPRELHSQCHLLRRTFVQLRPNQKGAMTVSFNSGSLTTVYLAINGGWLEDGQVKAFKFSDFRLRKLESEREEQVLAKMTAWTKYFYGGNISVRDL